MPPNMRLSRLDMPTTLFRCSFPGGNRGHALRPWPSRPLDRLCAFGPGARKEKLMCPSVTSLACKPGLLVDRLAPTKTIE